MHYINHGPVDCNTVFTHEDLKGKTAIVTGGEYGFAFPRRPVAFAHCHPPTTGSKGLGAHYVRALAHAGSVNMSPRS